MTSRPSTAAPLLAVLVIVLVTLGAYAGGYFWLGEYSESLPTVFHRHVATRTFSHDWQISVFNPAGRAESRLRGIDVIVTTLPDDDGLSNPY